MRKVRYYSSLMKGKSSLVIVMQDNPDPDSIASAAALRKFANTLAQIVCSIAHGGTVGRAENRARKSASLWLSATWVST